MTKVVARLFVAAILSGVPCAGVSAQDVLMNSAETINKGNVKLTLFPTILLGRGGGDNDWGLAGRVGVGLTTRFDIEAKGAVFDGLEYFGGDAEVWLVRNSPLDVSAAVGGHKTDREFGADSSGIDASFLVSGELVGRLELYGGLKAAFDSFDGGGDVTLVHAVPGIEYRVHDDLDFLAEVGIALNDDSRSYFSIGLAFYFR